MIYDVTDELFKSFLSGSGAKKNYENVKGAKMKFDSGGAEDGRSG